MENQNHPQKINNLADACKVLGIKKIKFGKVGRPTKTVRANTHLSIIVKALNTVSKFSFEPRNLKWS